MVLHKTGIEFALYEAVLLNQILQDVKIRLNEQSFDILVISFDLVRQSGAFRRPFREYRVGNRSILIKIHSRYEPQACHPLR